MKSPSDPGRWVPIPVVVLVSLWLLFVVVFFSDAGSDIFAFLVLFYGSVLWGGIWLVRLIVSLVRQRKGSIPRQTPQRALIYWGFEPAALLVCGVLAVTGVLYQVRFRLCRSALEAYAADVVAGRITPQEHGAPKRWVGLFRVAETELLPGDIVRLITAADFMDDAGFVCSPGVPPPRIGEDTYRRITGSWYHWHRSW